MDHAAWIAERRIAEAMDRGEFDGLPGRGRPLKLDDDSHVRPELRLAYRICKNAGVLPPELEERQQLVSLRELIRSADEGPEREERMREFNYRLMCFNIKAGRALSLELFGEYELRVAQRLSGSAGRGDRG